MRKLLFLLFFAVISFPILFQATAGTSVGNFKFKLQKEFDFVLGYPENWKWESATFKEGSLAEKWRVENSVKAQDLQKVSSADISFLRDFPASNDQELLTHIRQVHPTLSWAPMKKPTFAVGYRSNQVFIGPSRTRSFEYYFSDKHKIVRIEIIRDSHANGATELDMILDTIRRPSHLPQIESIQSNLKPEQQAHVGDEVCYQIKVTSEVAGPNANQLKSVNFESTLEHWSFKNIRWEESTRTFHLCTKVNARFSEYGLALKKFTIDSGEKELSCNGTVDGRLGVLECQHSKSNLKQRIVYHIPRVSNPKVSNRAPRITRMQIGRSPRHLRLEVDSDRPLSIGEIVIDAEGEKQPLSQIIYPEQMRASEFEIEFAPERLPPGLTRVMEIMLVDDVGNAIVLRSEPPSPRYKAYTSDGKPFDTSFPVLSLTGGEK